MITVETTVDQPVEKTWEYFSGPDHITSWCQASDDWHAPYAENDLREGGKFITTMAARDGSMQFDFGGTYTRVNPNQLIEYTIGDGRKVKVVFESNGNQTKVIESFDPESQNSEELQRSGWQAILDNFKKYADGK